MRGNKQWTNAHTTNSSQTINRNMLARARPYTHTIHRIASLHGRETVFSSYFLSVFCSLSLPTVDWRHSHSNDEEKNITKQENIRKQKTNWRWLQNKYTYRPSLYLCVIHRRRTRVSSPLCISILFFFPPLLINNNSNKLTFLSNWTFKSTGYIVYLRHIRTWKTIKRRAERRLKSTNPPKTHSDLIRYQFEWIRFFSPLSSFTFNICTINIDFKILRTSMQAKKIVQYFIDWSCIDATFDSMYLCCAAADRSKCIRKDIHQIEVRKGNALDRTTKKEERSKQFVTQHDKKKQSCFHSRIQWNSQVIGNFVCNNRNYRHCPNDSKTEEEKHAIGTHQFSKVQTERKKGYRLSITPVANVITEQNKYFAIDATLCGTSHSANDSERSKEQQQTRPDRLLSIRSNASWSIWYEPLSEA